jgi:type VI secretion system protein ImpF
MSTQTRQKGIVTVDSHALRSPRRADSHFLPTLLDRLRDDAPHRRTEAPGEYAVTRSQLRDIVQRDLAYLLNTTNLGNQIDVRR